MRTGYPATDDSSAAARALALDKLEAAEAVARFYMALQRYDCAGEEWSAIEELIADEMTYITPHLIDPRPLLREEFLALFKAIHDVHSAPGRGSFYGLALPIVVVDGSGATVREQITMSHWLSAEGGQSTWFYGSIEARLMKRTESWKLTALTVDVVRVEGHEPPINHLYPSRAPR